MTFVDVNSSMEECFLTLHAFSEHCRWAAQEGKLDIPSGVHIIMENTAV